ncbi:hypothetical protein BJX61DRAFT_312488 [Aspergillus egyptiacus]|nr:hypothetical protein BJX61DRAFT_312488 [Aspergillus egyptiacus]
MRHVLKILASAHQHDSNPGLLNARSALARKILLNASQGARNSPWCGSLLDRQDNTKNSHCRMIFGRGRVRSRLLLREITWSSVSDLWDAPFWVTPQTRRSTHDQKNQVASRPFSSDRHGDLGVLSSTRFPGRRMDSTSKARKKIGVRPRHPLQDRGASLDMHIAVASALRKEGKLNKQRPKILKEFHCQLSIIVATILFAHGRDMLREGTGPRG